MLCVDLITLMKEHDLKVLDSRKGTLFRNEEDKFTFTEKGARPHEVRMEKHWQVLDRCTCQTRTLHPTRGLHQWTRSCGHPRATGRADG